MQDTDSHLSNADSIPKKFDSISKNKEAITDQQVLIAGGGHVGLSFVFPWRRHFFQFHRAQPHR